MIRRLLLSVLLVCGAPSAFAQAPPPAQASGPMRFEWVREGPAEACGDRCREWVAAEGAITADTPRDFAFFAEARDVRGAMVVLNSAGGSVTPALALGRALRAKAVTTTVGHTEKLSTGAGAEQGARLSLVGICASMCPFVLLGGMRRQVPRDAHVLVHQIWPRAKRADPYAETFPAGEVALMLREAGMLARYTIDMGGDIELYETAMRIPPWERLRPLTEAEMRRMRLINAEDAVGATSGDDGKRRPMVPARADPAGAPADAAWTIAEIDGKLGLRRKSPITIEGLPVGSFEVAFACTSAGNYSVDYGETRRLPPGAAGDRLRRVVMAAGSERTVLRIESSAAEAEGELRSIAHGIVPRSFVDALAGATSKSLVVGTQTLRNTQVVIRIGSVGFAQSYTKLADSCPK